LMRGLGAPERGVGCGQSAPTIALSRRSSSSRRTSPLRTSRRGRRAAMPRWPTASSTSSGSCAARCRRRRSITDSSLLEGRVAASTIQARQFITSQSFVSASEGGGGSLASAIADRGLVAVTVSVGSDRGVAGQIDGKGDESDQEDVLHQVGALSSFVNLDWSQVFSTKRFMMPLSVSTARRPAGSVGCRRVNASTLRNLYLPVSGARSLASSARCAARAFREVRVLAL
jgi:hypothetical protein